VGQGSSQSSVRKHLQVPCYDLSGPVFSYFSFNVPYTSSPYLHYGYSILITAIVHVYLLYSSRLSCLFSISCRSLSSLYSIHRHHVTRTLVSSTIYIVFLEVVVVKQRTSSIRLFFFSLRSHFARPTTVVHGFLFI